jgi:NADH-quinone oxidoreductase subunit C
MNAQEISDRLKEKFGDNIIELVTEPPSDPYIIIKPDNLVELALFLRDDEEMLFDYLNNLSGIDYVDNLCVVYHLYSIKLKHRLVLKIKLDKENAVVPSVERVWKTANWHEREAWDMFGIKFEGHPNLIRILSPYDWEGHPLRKDYVTPEFYHGIKVPY